VKAPRKPTSASNPGPLTPTSLTPTPLTKGGADTPDERAAAALLARLPRVSVSGPAVERVWRGVTSPPSRSPRLSEFARYAGVAAAFTALFVGVLWSVLGGWGGSALKASHVGTPRVELAYSAGGVFAATQAKDWHASRTGEALSESDRLRTDDAGRALVRIRTVASVLVGEKSDLEVLRLSSGTTLRLTQGTLTARVSKRAPGEQFVVEAGHYRVRVVGTLFTVEEGPGDHTAVSVREGVVEVTNMDDGRQVDRVVAGARWTSETPAARGEDRTPNDLATLLEADLAAGSTRDLARGFGTLTRTEAPTNASAANASNESAPAPASPSRDPLPERPVREEVHRAASETANRATATRAVSSAALAVSAAPLPAPMPVPEPSAAVAPAPAVSASPPPIANDAGVEPYARGMELEANGDLDGAARELAKAADRDPLHGDLALYSLGRLQHRRLHDPSSALATFRRYRARYPLGALLPEVDFEVLQLDLETHDRSGALAETARFLASHPGSERTSQVHLLRGNLLRDGGHCPEALSEYAAVREEPLTGDALYSTAYCERKLGDRAAAAKTLTEYVRRFPHGEHASDAARALESGREIEAGGEK
jgi:TolA-binding protein